MRRLQTFALLLLVLGGCGRIDVIPSPPPSPPASTADYDLGIVSVDFDPALQGNRLPVNDTYAVLAAVENRGALTAYNVRVKARLLNEDGGLVLEGAGALESLAPGAIAVVRIQPAGSLPAEFATYTLTVRAEPLPNESTLSNNTRTFTIQVAP
ncbi:MAG TPA: hypothetical protein VGE07_12980 [Herpetosiphonaceae bacterium]